jgi:hypothetical protein
MMHLASVIERKLGKFYDLYSMSLRTIQLNGPVPHQRRKDIWELQFTVTTFISFADLCRSLE